MATKICAAITALVFLFFGVTGFIPSLVYVSPWHLRVLPHDGGYPQFLFGWMPVNTLHNLLYLAMGGAGLLGAISFKSAKLYCRAMFALTFLLMLTGLSPFGISWLWGLIPLYGWQIPVHVVTAILTWYYGYVYPLDFTGEPSPA